MIRDENIKITITIPKKLHNEILQEASYYNRSVSNLVCRILKKHYDFEINDKE